MEKEYYKAFVAQTPEVILQSVFNKKEDVLIAICLNNGTYIEGIILDITKEENRQTVVCMLTHEEQVSFFYEHNVVFVTIKQPKKMVVELSKGAISRPFALEAENLSGLQLKRWLNTEKVEFGNHVTELNIENIPLENINNRLNVQDFFKALKIAVNQITKDALGQEVWRSIQIIKLQKADILNIEINGNILHVSITVEKALPKELNTVLEEKLLQIL